MVILLVLVACLFATAGLLFSSVEAIGAACFLGLLARLRQAHDQRPRRW